MVVGSSQLAVRKHTVISAYDFSDYRITTGLRGLFLLPAGRSPLVVCW